MVLSREHPLWALSFKTYVWPSRINTVVMLAIPSNLRCAELPGNVAVKKGAADLPKPCVVNVSQIKSVDNRKKGVATRMSMQ